jgi:hypothetical protein
MQSVLPDELILQLVEGAKFAERERKRDAVALVRALVIAAATGYGGRQRDVARVYFENGAPPRRSRRLLRLVRSKARGHPGGPFRTCPVVCAGATSLSAAADEAFCARLAHRRFHDAQASGWVASGIPWRWQVRGPEGSQATVRWYRNRLLELGARRSLETLAGGGNFVASLLADLLPDDLPIWTYADQHAPSFAVCEGTEGLHRLA